MDVEAEILDLKLRVRALEASEAGGAPIAATTSGMAAVEAEIADFRTEVRQDLVVLGDELAGFRWHTNERLKSLRAETLDGLTSLFRDMIELRLMLDWLLEKDRP
ncbi:hypothetical protein [Nonomuraea sp. SYSU D8015]|uniref:hypothetical protein n=1 Tax=Nonomuraea sp. SYSU D8015 TaxID=2593644 RepID=UPI001660956C|nr:hypothetical protein [Nonomuraea sp. SYSU D8015]